MIAHGYVGKRVTVMGLGLFGGGAAAARFYAERGAHVTVTDLRDEKELRPTLETLRDLPLRYVLSRHQMDDFTNADIVVVNPAVPNDSAYVVAARAAGARLEREMNLVFKLTPNHPKLGITGSNGKSTTAALLGAMVKLSDENALLGGNLGGSLLDRIEHLHGETPLVLELSSFMLEGLRELEESPRIAVITNLTPNHLDRHGTFNKYLEAKRTILDYQKPGDVAVLNADDPLTVEWGKQTRGHVVWFSATHEPAGDAAFLDGDRMVLRLGNEEEVVALRSGLRLPGVHNTANALAAAAAACAFGVRPWEVTEALATFSGLPHRLEMVARSPRDVKYYNDSIATTPESAICALRSFNGPLTLIAGGYDKGTDFDELGRAIARRVRRLILLGATAERLEQAVAAALTEEKPAVPPRIEHAADLDEAASLAGHDALPGEIVLLSPACASYDMFANFVERGERFRRLAKTMAS